MATQSLLRRLDRVPGGRLLKHAVAAALDPTPLPYAIRLRMRRLGFKAEAHVLYEFDRNDPGDYLADRYWRAMADLDGETVQALLGNKLLFHHTFRDDLPLPETFAILARGRFVANPRAQRVLASFDDLVAYIHEVGPVMLKPIAGGKGKGVHRVEASDGGLAFDGRPVEPAALRAAVSGMDGLLATEYARQAGYAASIFPGSANTLRLIVMRDVDTGEPFVPAAMHRFGRTATVPVDNYSSGGVFAGIDVTTGELGPLHVYDPKRARSEWRDDHPDTGAAVRGVIVPGWQEVVERIAAFTRRHPYFTFVGWDVVKTDEGMSVLEANYGAGLQIQVVTPFLRDVRIRRFLDVRGILPDGDATTTRARAATEREP